MVLEIIIVTGVGYVKDFQGTDHILFPYLGIYMVCSLCKNFSNVHLRFMHFLVCIFYFNIKFTS